MHRPISVVALWPRWGEVGGVDGTEQPGERGWGQGVESWKRGRGTWGWAVSEELVSS